MATRFQTEHVSVKLPSGFDPSKHENQLIKLIGERYGPGWEIDHIDPTAQTASASRQASIVEVTETRADEQKNVKLPKTTKPGDGDKMATKFEAQYEGYYLTAFEPYLGWATLTKLNDETARARGAIAVALGVKPWDIQIQQTADGGFEFTLPKGFVPSKHEAKLQEVAESVVGKEGWYVTTNAQRLHAKIIPADPPTFPGAIPYPFNAKYKKYAKGNSDWAKLPIGAQLGKGSETGGPMILDLEAAPHGMVSGTSGGGKSVVLNGIIAGALARGMQLSIIDLPAKAVDFIWCRKYVGDGYWGCDSLESAVATLAMLYAEGQRRAKILAEHEVTKAADLPAGIDMQPILIIVDEVTGLFFPEEVPKGLPKDSDLVVDAQNINMLKATLRSYISRIAAEMRFTNLRLVLSSQVSSTTTGVPTSIRMNLANKILLGSKPTDNNRRLSLSDATSVPKVPENIASDDKAGRGVGVTEFEGQKPAVFKGYFATTKQYDEWLSSLGTPTTNRPSPTPGEIARHTPALAESAESGGYGRDEKYEKREDGLKGAAAAAHDMKVAEMQAAKAARASGTPA